MVQKHVAFAHASQKQLGSRLRSPKSIEEIASLLRSSQRPLSLSHGFFTMQSSPSEEIRQSRAACMSERSELRSRREERNLNGIGVRLCHYFGERASFYHLDIICRKSLTPMGARPFSNTPSE